MDKEPKNSHNYVNLLVFKDNFASRSFQVPLSWFTRLGVILTSCLLITTGSALFGVKQYFLSQKSAPERLSKLEREISELQASKVALEAKIASGTNTVTEPTPAPSQEVNQNNSTPPALAQAPSAPQANPNLPFSVQQLSTSWNGNTLKVHFVIQYVKGDGGNQQGRIVVLGRGPTMLLSYPDNIIAPVGNPHFLNSDEGEYFSVSRFREVNADLGPLASRGSIHEVEILLFNASNQIMYLQKIPVKGRPSADSGRKPQSGEENK